MCAMVRCPVIKPTISPPITGQQKTLLWSPVGSAEGPHIQVQPRNTYLASSCVLWVLNNETVCAHTHLAELRIQEGSQAELRRVAEEGASILLRHKYLGIQRGWEGREQKMSTGSLGVSERSHKNKSHFRCSFLLKSPMSCGWDASCAPTI